MADTVCQIGVIIYKSHKYKEMADTVCQIQLKMISCC